MVLFFFSRSFFVPQAKKTDKEYNIRHSSFITYHSSFAHEPALAQRSGDLCEAQAVLARKLGRIAGYL